MDRAIGSKRVAPGTSERRNPIAAIGLGVALGVAMAGCAAEPHRSLVFGEPYRLGMGVPEATLDDTDTLTVRPSKVLSAIAFERVTGSPVDPARLVER